jgi:carboxylesterase type B
MLTLRTLETKDDGTLLVPSDIATEDDCKRFVTTFFPNLADSSISTMLSLYSASDYTSNPLAGLSASFYRCAAIIRDTIFACPVFLFGSLLKQTQPVYFYLQNQTILDGMLDSLGLPGLGIIHTSELPYVFGNTDIYSGATNAIQVDPSDGILARAMSRSCSTFAATGNPVALGRDTIQNWGLAYNASASEFDAEIFVSGGPTPGLSALDGPSAHPALARGRLAERCEFWMSEELIKQLQY